MRCLVVGCGSIGTRRAKVLAEMGHEVDGLDDDLLRAANATDGHAVTWDHVKRFKVPYDAAFICTPADVRFEPIREVLKAGVKGLFVEKPIALDMVTAGVILGLLDSHNIVDMGACNLRYDERLAGFGAGSVTEDFVCRMGQAAKYWSPSHNPITIILDSIHELDLMRYLGGQIKSLEGESTKNMAWVKAVHEGFVIGFVDLDRVSDPPERYVQIGDPGKYGEDGLTNLWPPDMEMYRREMEDFLKCVELGKPSPNPLAQAAETLKWALEVVG